jgi:hypothetical protein
MGDGDSTEEDYHQNNSNGLEKRSIMGFMNFLPVVIAIAFCAVGFLALAIIGFILAVAVWGFKHWNVRMVTNQRNFDDFGR